MKQKFAVSTLIGKRPAEKLRSPSCPEEAVDTAGFCMRGLRGCGAMCATPLCPHHEFGLPLCPVGRTVEGGVCV